MTDLSAWAAFHYDLILVHICGSLVITPPLSHPSISLVDFEEGLGGCIPEVWKGARSSHSRYLYLSGPWPHLKDFALVMSLTMTLSCP